jgi:DNA-damage-inducible protein D
MIEVGKGAKRPAKSVMMSRYACYLVIQNADPSKEIVAQGQTYFAIQTRRQELSDEDVEEQRRLAIRSELRNHNSQLADAAKDAGVIEPRGYAIFQNHGYIGLYGGLGAQGIHSRKGLKNCLRWKASRGWNPRQEKHSRSRNHQRGRHKIVMFNFVKHTLESCKRKN